MCHTFWGVGLPGKKNLGAGARVQFGVYVHLGPRRALVRQVFIGQNIRCCTEGKNSGNSRHKGFAKGNNQCGPPRLVAC